MTTKKIYGPWIDWHGGERPVSPDTLVQVRFRDGTIEPVQAASEYCWHHHNDDADIVEYCAAIEQVDLDAAEQLLCAHGYTVIPPTKPLTFEDVVPDGYGGAAMSKIKRGMTKYDCWPEHDDCPRRQDALICSRGFSTSLQNKE